jgi:transcriptional regulator
MSDSRLYNPAAFKNDEPDLLADVIEHIVFGTLICNGADGPTASHLPFRLERGGSGKGTLHAHLARPNDHWQSLDATPVLVIFQGPAYYVSPSWYPTKAVTGKVVPTWNYVVVHARGRARVWHDPERLRELVTALTNHQGFGREAPWAVDDAPADYLATMLANIVGVSIELTSLEGKFKLGQNRSAADRSGLAAGLAAERPDVAAALAAFAGTRPSGLGRVPS